MAFAEECRLSVSQGVVLGDRPGARELDGQLQEGVGYSQLSILIIHVGGIEVNSYRFTTGPFFLCGLEKQVADVSVAI